MRLATVSILSLFISFSAFANARLPIVNVAAGAVSARAAFGEKVPIKAEMPVAISQKTATKQTISVDTGEKIVASRGDVLSPRRPSGDLWARVEKPLRLPEPQEISVLRNEHDLPEESLDYESEAVAQNNMESFEVSASYANTGVLDAEIAKLVELQRKADESIRVASLKNNKPSNISSFDAVRTSVSPRKTAKPAPVARKETVPERINPSEGGEDIAIRRVVVPIEEDVIIRKAKTDAAPRFASADDQDLAKMSPSELKKAFKKTYMSENKHLSTYKIDDRFDTVSDLSKNIEGFTAERDLSEAGGVRPLEIKISFRDDDSALSRDNYNLLSEYASIIVSNPKRAIQISIPERMTQNLDNRRLTARRLAIIEQVLRDTGVSERRVLPVLSQRKDESFVLRVISSDQYETITQQKRDMFGDTVSRKSYKSMSW